MKWLRSPTGSTSGNSTDARIWTKMRYQPASTATKVKAPPVFTIVSPYTTKMNRLQLLNRGSTHNLQPARQVRIPIGELPICASQSFKSNNQTKEDGHKSDICSETGQEKEEGKKSDEEEVECYDRRPYQRKAQNLGFRGAIPNDAWNPGFSGLVGS
jgi:hypothetical protein